MAKDNFNWKSLFINEEGNEENEPKKVEKPSTSFSTAFPEANHSATSFPTDIPISVSVNGDILKTIVELYESGFESLNQPGYDFYEFFKAIKAVGSHDPQVYKMALTMAQSVDKKVTKSTLLAQADFYIEEIDKVYKQYQAQGNSKKSQIIETQNNKKESLTVEISKLEKQLMEIQNKISTKRNELQTIDTTTTSEVAEIDQKIVANEKARGKITETIMAVVNGIKNNL